MIQIRTATAADAPGIAKVHVDGWRATYEGIVPSEHLASLSYDKKAESWGHFLKEMPPRQHLLVAVDNDTVVGFTNGGANRATESAFDGEVMAIYLRKDYQRAGLGRRLLQASMDHLVADGFKSMLVWVLEDNPTCGFYARMSAQVVGEKIATIGGKPLKELAYGWAALPATASGNRIYHIVDRKVWEQAKPSGEYSHPSLAKQGFIHASKATQVVDVANHNFHQHHGLVLLEIAEARLVEPVKYENLDGGDELYPHIYGPLNCDAVVDVHLFEPLPDGTFVLPEALLAAE